LPTKDQSHRAIKGALAGALLFLLNVYVCWGLSRVEYLDQMGSIEAAYIGLTRYMLAHWPDFSWFPLWYGGVPAQNAYPPLLNWIVSLLALLRGFSPAHAYHWVTALFYCLGPVTLFALILRLSGSLRAAFIAGAFYSVLSPSEWLMPSVARDTGQWHPERLTVLVHWGEGPHVAALALLPLAILFLHLAIERKRAPYFALAAVSFASVALTNWLAAFALALGIVAYLLATLGSGKLGLRDFAFVVLLVIAAYCLALPWIPPSTIAAAQHNSKLSGGDYRQTGDALLRWAPAALLLLLVLKLALRRVPVYLQFAVYFVFLTAVPTLLGEWEHISIIPQPERYHLEMELALALLAGLLLDAALRRLPGRAPLFATATTTALLLALVWPAMSDRGYAQDKLIRTIDITTTSEWRTAQWLNQHWNGGRVLLPATSAFWLTAFSDTPEFDGAYAQGTTIPVYFMARYVIGTGEATGSHDTEFSILWLKAMGVQAVAVDGPGSTEVYKDFRNPQKFEGVLQPLWRDRGDVLYRVGASTSLAHVLAQGDLVARTPVNGLDVAQIRPYVAALDDPRYPPAPLEWTSLHSAKIQTDLPANSAVSIQMSWSAGWHAQINGQALRVFKDGLGFMYILPNATGPASITLDYDGGFEMAAARWISGITLALLALACLWSWRKSKGAPAP
jgi:hypothetical protein